MSSAFSHSHLNLQQYWGYEVKKHVFKNNMILCNKVIVVLAPACLKRVRQYKVKGTQGLSLRCWLDQLCRLGNGRSFVFGALIEF